jgi:transposase
MANLLRMGWFRPVHIKTMDAREQRALLAARATLGRRLRDIENSVRGLLRGFGVRAPRLLRGRWDAAVRDFIEGHPSLRDRSGAISKDGDASVRVALFEAAHVMMTRVVAW